MCNNALCFSFCLMSEIYFYGLASMANCNLNTSFDLALDTCCKDESAASCGYTVTYWTLHP